MTKEYTHELQVEYHSISGRYEPEKEEKILVDGKEVLYVVGNAVMDSSCCGPWGCRYALVPGYVVKWKYKKDDKGNPVSLVKTLINVDVSKELAQLLKAKEGVMQVQFW